MADSMRGRRFSPSGAKAAARKAFLTGFAPTIPVFVTLFVVGFVVNSLSNSLDPVVFIFELTGSQLQADETPAVLLQLVALTVLLVTIFCIGFVAERRSGQSRIETVFDAMMQRIPGIDSLYTSFDGMSEMLLDSDTQSFTEVVLVEHPTAESYTVAFVTASTPAETGRATGCEEMVTLFMPMAPNPVMGGHVVHIQSKRVYDVDMTVEEGIRSIVTSGVAIGESGVSPSFGGQAGKQPSYPPQSRYQPGGGGREPTPQPGATEREAAYREDIDLEHVDTPDSVARHRREETVGDDASHPAELDRQSGTIGDDTARPDEFDQSGGTVGSEAGTPGEIELDEEGQN